MTTPRDPRFDQFLARLVQPGAPDAASAPQPDAAGPSPQLELTRLTTHLRRAHEAYRAFQADPDRSSERHDTAAFHCYCALPNGLRNPASLPVRAAAHVLLGHLELTRPDRPPNMRFAFSSFMKGAIDVRMGPRPHLSAPTDLNWPVFDGSEMAFSHKPVLPDLERPCDPVHGWQDWPLLGRIIEGLPDEKSLRQTISLVNQTKGSLHETLDRLHLRHLHLTETDPQAAAELARKVLSLQDLLSQAKDWYSQVHLAQIKRDQQALASIPPPSCEAVGVLIGSLPRKIHRLNLTLTYRRLAVNSQQPPDADDEGPSRPQPRG